MCEEYLFTTSRCLIKARDKDYRLLRKRKNFDIIAFVDDENRINPKSTQILPHYEREALEKIYDSYLRTFGLSLELFIEYIHNIDMYIVLQAQINPFTSTMKNCIEREIALFTLSSLVIGESWLQQNVAYHVCA